jgi:tol-pal system protein YbgF
MARALSFDQNWPLLAGSPSLSGLHGPETPLSWRVRLILSTVRRKAVAGLCALAVALGISVPGASAQTLLPPGELGGLTFTNTEPARFHVAQAQDTAQLMVRIQQLEEQVRVLNGQVEGLTFQLTQMQEMMTRLQESGTAATAAQQPAPSTPAVDPNGVPLTEIPEQGVQPLPGEAEFDPTFTDGSQGESSDPLIGTGATGGVDLATGQPLDLSFDPAAAPSGNADADAQFTAGYQALAAGDYAFAEDQFSQFLELYPDNPQATDAANWLGDALIYRSAYSEAADVLLNAFQKAPDSPRAPDLLLKLGMSLAGAGERETACRTFAEIDKRYTALAPAFVTRLGEEKTRAECPPA